MGDKETTKSPRPLDMQEVVTDSEDNFQNIICEVLEKNGVMSDLRAYLRQSIINVLSSSDTGEPLACQKHFTQRLELPNQAINILIAEYLLRFDFSYSLSVFVAEIPLANMVFDFANNLMMGEEASDLRFKNKDIWSILNYLGIKCDSNFVRNILDSYNNNKTPLLVCILKNLFVFNSNRDGLKSEISTLTGAPRSPGFPRSPYSEESDLLSDTTSKMHTLNKCQHCTACLTCASRIQLWKEKYLKTKLLLAKNQTSIDSVKVQQFLSNVDNIEGNVISEMFEDVRTVYETEMDKMRSVEEQRRQTRELDLAAMEVALRQEMEASYKAREAELETSVRAKKQFLWELARSLRAQHQHVARAARAVTRHAHALRDQEDNQKSQLGKIESILKRQGEDIQSQISSEMNVLEEKLDAVKTEREAIVRERSSLELKEQQTNDSPSESSSHLLRKELSVLKKYIEAVRTEPKCLIDRSTITDGNSCKTAEGWNNEHEVKAVKEDDRIKNSQVVNDLKKKNVNFCADLTSVMRNPEESTGSPDSGASRVSGVITQLKQENERLREYARQQELQVQQLSQSSAILRAELSLARDLSRPRTAPATLFNRGPGGGGPGAGTGARSLVGAGEELCALAPRALLPGEPVPFIGLLRDRRPDARRLLNQWKRSRRISPMRSRRSPPHVAGPSTDAEGAGPSYKPGSEQEDDQLPSNIEQHSHLVNAKQSPERNSPSYTITNVNRTKSAKSVIREAKEKLRNHAKAKLKGQVPSSSRDKSPASVLREAKQKLRKLEIEAEAVERSYRDYKQRQWHSPQREEALVTKDVAEAPSRSCKPTSTSKPQSSRKLTLDINSNFNKYLSESIRKLSDTQFANRNTVNTKVKPIPTPFSEDFENPASNFLETPLTEFRKYYQQPPHRVTIASAETHAHTTPFAHKPTLLDAEKEISINQKKNNKVIELEILQNNIHKMYNITPHSHADYKPGDADRGGDTKAVTNDEGKQLLRIEVEPVKGVGVININNEKLDQHNLVVMVQSKADTTAEPTPTAQSVATTHRGDHRESLISPKQNKERSDRDRSRSMSPEQAARLTRNDVLEAIFHKDTVTIRSSSDMRDVVDCNSKAEDSIGTIKGESYEDDFSGDADNYNSRSSPVSLPASPPDEAFWNDS